jgi:hypothetical protein
MPIPFRSLIPMDCSEYLDTPDPTVREMRLAIMIRVEILHASNGTAQKTLEPAHAMI